MNPTPEGSRDRPPGHPRLCDEGDDLLSKLVDMFVSEVPLQLAALEEVLIKGDVGATRLAAHTLKGTAGNFGAPRYSAC